MKVHPLRTLSAKLFFLSVILVAGTVAALTFKNSNDLSRLLENQLRDRSMTTSENSGKSIESTLDSWQSQLLLLLKSVIQETDRAQIQNHLSSFIANSDDYVALQIFKRDGEEIKELTFGYTDRTDSNRFGSLEAISVSKVLRAKTFSFAKRVMNEKSEGLVVNSLARDTGLPMLRLAKLFKARGQDVTFLVVLVAWQAPLIETLIQSAHIQHFVLDEWGRVLTSRSLKHMIDQTSFKSFALVSRALKGGSHQGFEKDYVGFGKKWLGGFYRIPEYNLVVLVQQDVDSAYSDIDKSIFQTLQWGALFIMLALLVSYFGADSVTRHLRSVTQATQKIADGDFEVKIPLKSKDEVTLLADSVNTMSLKIRQLLEAQVAQAEVKKDLEMARTVQETLFPKESRSHGVLEVVGFSESASETGGDWWGRYDTGDGIEYVFVADAMGHGVPAALVTAVAYSSCMTLANLLTDNQQIFTPGQILERVNRVLYDAVEGKISMTFFVLMVDYHEGKIIFANAGHNLPVVIPADPDDDRIKKKIKSLQKIHKRTPLSLKVNGTILGVDKNALFIEKKMELRPGDRFFLFTDGLIECKSPNGRMWGRKGMLEYLLKYLDLPLKSWMDSVREEAYVFFDSEPRDDDLTIVAVEFPANARIGGYRSENLAVVSNISRVLSEAEAENNHGNVVTDDESKTFVFDTSVKTSDEKGLDMEDIAHRSDLASDSVRSRQMKPEGNEHDLVDAELAFHFTASQDVEMPEKEENVPNSASDIENSETDFGKLALDLAAEGNEEIGLSEKEGDPFAFEPMGLPPIPIVDSTETGSNEEMVFSTASYSSASNQDKADEVPQQNPLNVNRSPEQLGEDLVEDDTLILGSGKGA